MLTRGRKTDRDTTSTIALTSKIGCSASTASTSRRMLATNPLGSDAVRTMSAMPLSGCWYAGMKSSARGSLSRP